MLHIINQLTSAKNNPSWNLLLEECEASTWLVIDLEIEMGKSIEFDITQQLVFSDSSLFHHILLTVCHFQKQCTKFCNPNVFIFVMQNATICKIRRLYMPLLLIPIVVTINSPSPFLCRCNSSFLLFFLSSCLSTGF